MNSHNIEQATLINDVPLHDWHTAWIDNGWRMAEQKKTPEKSSKAVVAQRVDEVIDLLLAGAMARDIVHYGSEKGWQVGAASR